MEESLQSGKKAIFGIASRFFLIVLVGMVFLSAPVLAQDGSFSVSPLYHEITILEGDQVQRIPMELTNRTDADAAFRLSSVDFGALDESGGVAFLGGDGDFEKRYGLASWIIPENDTVIIPAGTSETIYVRLENRESLSPGGHYGAMLFQMVQDEPISAENSSVSIRSSFASLFFVKKQGGEVVGFEYKGISDTRVAMSGIPEKISVKFQDSGNIHLVPRGRILVTDMFGRIVRKGIINDDSGRILPESFRVFPVMLKPVSRAYFPGKYSVSVEYRYDGKEEMTISQEESVYPIGMNVLWVFGSLSVVALSIGSVRMKMKRKRNPVIPA